MMWLLQMEHTDVVEIKHPRKRREYRLPELPHVSVDGYCPESRRAYEFLFFFWHRHHCQPFGNVITTTGDTLAARYEQTVSRLEQVTRAAYQVNVQR